MLYLTFDKWLFCHSEDIKDQNLLRTKKNLLLVLCLFFRMLQFIRSRCVSCEDFSV